MNEVIKLENVVKMYPGTKRAINDISMSIGEKQRAVIQGAAGSGKRTLMRLIAGMEPPSSGSIEILGKAVHEMDEGAAANFRSSNIGVVLEHPGFLQRLNVLENVEIPLAVRGISLKQREQAARRQLKNLGMMHTAYAYPSQLSTLEAQTASLARALVIQPKILLLQDIFAVFSEKETEKFADIMNAVWKCGDYTALYFTDTAFAMNADRLITLEHGKIREDIS